MTFFKYNFITYPSIIKTRTLKNYVIQKFDYGGGGEVKVRLGLLTTYVETPAQYL
jgi:hypothetical protein